MSLLTNICLDAAIRSSKNGAKDGGQATTQYGKGRCRLKG